MSVTRRLGSVVRGVVARAIADGGGISLHVSAASGRLTLPMTTHPVQRRLRVEELLRLRRADEERRWVASQRAGRIDPNPHQIDAVIFALSRLQDGGCILADEVGLGKTIEAGLVIAQLLSEGAERILLLTPKPLLGQWREELYTLFGLSAREGRAEEGAFEEEGIWIVGRETAGTAGASSLIGKQRWDLCVIDEAHEVFAGIYQRYDASGAYRHDSKKAKTAAAVKQAIGTTPVLLLTATPIQNSLLELWGLVQYVDPSGTLLGDLPTFRAVFTSGDDRQVAPGAGHELRKRVSQVVQRTLRRQAQEFMERPFVGRRAKTFGYSMAAEEKSLYDDVTRYLLRPNLQAFRGSHRSLLLLGFHRRMASSKAALAASLRNVESRLSRMLAGSVDDPEAAQQFGDDFDDDELAEALREEERDESEEVDTEAVEKELAHVSALRERAESLGIDSKARALIRAVRECLGRSDDAKVVIFTESLTTQDYLRTLLVESGIVSLQEVTLFRGTNDGARAREALTRWEEEVEAKAKGRSKPSRNVAQRLALVHELRTRSRVFISTEAGAKGLNLQFCDTLINYDLPWNPQRIEQRIGRIHRYGQTNDVMVINFLAEDNEAQRLTYEILSRKLALFGTVLGASDEVLHQGEGEGPSELVLSAIGVDFEKQLGAIYRRARSVEEIEAGLKQLRESTEEKREGYEKEHARTRSLIESRLDETVRRVFERIRQRLPGELEALDAELEEVLVGYLEAIGAEYSREDGRYSIEAHPALPIEGAVTVCIGDGAAETLHLSHPLFVAAAAEARGSTEEVGAVRLPEAPHPRGRLQVLKVRQPGLEPIERVHVVAAYEHEGELVPIDDARALLDGAVEAADRVGVVRDEALFEDLRDEVVFLDQHEAEDAEQPRFEMAMERLDRYVDDRALVLQRQRAVLDRRRVDAETARDNALSTSARTKAEKKLEVIAVELDSLDERIAELQDREDERYRMHRDALHRRRFAPPEITVLMDLEWTNGR